MIQTPIERVEPPFWYEGMNNPELQLLFYGKNISRFQISASNGLLISSVIVCENSNYLFVTINVEKCVVGTYEFYFREKNKIAFKQSYSIKKRRLNSATRKGFDSSDVIYLIFSDRFACAKNKPLSSNSNLTNFDRTNPNGVHGGNIRGIINNLDYIQELGVTTIWNTPVCGSTDTETTYHNYDQADVYKIAPRFGTMEDYLELSSELHQRKMKLIMDYVTNHWGLEHWILKDLPTKQWINQFESYTQTNHKKTVVHDIHASQIDKKNCLDGWFVHSMPDLNQSNELVLNYLIQNAIWWIEYTDLDGFRVDTFNYCDPTGISKWTKAILDEYPNFNMVGEVWMQNQAQIAYWQKDSKIGALQNFNSHLPTVMDFTLLGALNHVFNEDHDTWDKGLVKLYDNFTEDFLYQNNNNLLIFAENHDTHRLNHVYRSDPKKYKMAISVLATTRGIPQIYYGSEIGLSGNKDNGDADTRKDFPGGWKEDSENAFSVARRTGTQKEFFDFTAKIFNWRKNKSSVHFGKMTHYVPENNTYVYFRFDEKEAVMVVLNNSVENRKVSLNRFIENLKGYKTAKEVISESLFDLKNDLEIQGKSALIFDLF